MKAPSDPKVTKTYKNLGYNQCTKHEMWTVHKAKYYKLPDPKNEATKGIEDNAKNKWQLGNAIVTMQEEVDSTIK